MTEDQMKEWIDKASYIELLMKWRFAPIGDPFFSLKIGEYYAARMAEIQKTMPPEELTHSSKVVGWD